MADETKSQDQEVKIKLTYSTNADSVSADVGEFRDTIEDTTTAQKKNDDQVKKSEASTKSFKAQLREANEQLKLTIQTYGETSQEAANAARNVAELRDQMEFAADLADSFNPDQKMKALGAASDIAATGVSAVAAGYGLLGGQSEDTEKILLKVQAAMAFSDALSGLSDLGDKWSIFKTVVVDSYNKIVAARRADIVATEAQTVAERIKNSVILMNPYIAVAAALAAVTIATVAFIQHSNEAAAAQAKLNTEMGNTQSKLEGLKQSIEDYNEDAKYYDETEILRAKLKGVSETELQKLIRDQKQKTIEFVAQKDAEAYKAFNEASRNYHEATKLEDEEQIKQAEKTLDAAKDLMKETSNAYSNAIKDASVTTLQQQIDNQNKAEQIAKEAREKRKAAREKEEKERQAARDKWVQSEMEMYDKLRAEAALFDKEIEDAKKAYEDRAKTDQERKTDDENARFQKQLDKAKEMNKSTEFLELEHLNILNDINLEAEQKRLDDKKAKALEEKAIEEAKLAFKKEVTQAEFDLATQGVEFLKTIAGKNKALMKAAIIAESAIGIGKTVINTVEANAKAVAASPLTAGQPFVALNTVMGGLGIATNIAATAKALSAVGGGGDGASSGATAIPQPGGANGSAAPKVDFQGSSENQIANSVQSIQSELPPIRTFVVASEMTAQQETDTQSQNDNSLAGGND